MRTDLPRDCALAFGIPLSKDDFAADVHKTEKEFARRFESRLASLSMDSIWARYESAVAAPVHLAIESASAEGVRVEMRASSDKLRLLLREARVVTLFAHWRQGGFTKEWIHDPDWLESEIRRGRGPLSRALAQSLPYPARLDSDGWVKFLTESLNRLFVVEVGELEPDATWIANDPQQNFDRNYEVLRTEFPGWDLPPVGMELVDGIHSVADMVRMVPCDYGGTLDLRMCNSMLPGEAIKRAAPQAQVLMNSDEVTPQVQLAFYKQTIHLLATGEYDYAGAAIALRVAVNRRWV